MSSIEWEALNMNQEEEDLVCRMHKLVGDRFDPLKLLITYYLLRYRHYFVEEETVLVYLTLIKSLFVFIFPIFGERWELIAGRIPGRTAQEIESFWVMKNN